MCLFTVWVVWPNPCITATDLVVMEFTILVNPSLVIDFKLFVVFEENICKEILYFYIYFKFQSYFLLECWLMELTFSCLHIITIPFTKFGLHCHSSSWEDDVKARQPISINYPSDPGKLISLTCVTKQSLNIFCMHSASWRNYNIQTNHISYMNF